MIYKLFGIPLLFIFLTGLIRCKKEYYNASNKFNSVGTEFIYSVKDSTANETSIVTIRIVNNLTIRGKPMNVWVYYPNSTDTNYVYSNRDSIIIYDRTKSAVKSAYYLPLTVGRKWQNYHYTDTCYVINKENVTSSGIVYNDVYQIDEKASGFNYSLNKTEWFLPGTGLIKINVRERSLGPYEGYTWELVKIE